MYTKLGDEVREVARAKKGIAFAPAVWWCPFCDTSNQFKQDNFGGPMPCGKCGARVLLKAPEPLVGATVAGAPETPYTPVTVTEEPVEPSAPAPAKPSHDVPQPRTRGIGPSKRGRR